MSPEKLANTGWLAGLLIWFMAHIEVINGVLQFLVLIGTLIGLYFAVKYHRANTPKS